MRLPLFTWRGIEIPIRPRIVSWSRQGQCTADVPVCADGDDDEHRHECDSVELTWCDTLWIHGWRDASKWEACTPGQWVVYEPSRNPDDFGAWKAMAIVSAHARM